MKKGQTVVIKQSNLGNVVRTVVCLAGIGILVFTLITINRDKAKTVEVVQVKDNVYVNQLILEENLKSYPMSQLEYDNSKNKYLLWENRNQAIEKYATVATKKDGYLYSGDVADTKPLKNEWLQTVDKDNVVISLPYNKGESFGNILTPGDHVIVSVSYKEADPTGMTGTRDVQEILYDKAKVIDLLNSSGNSIYDYYSDLLALPVAEREKLLKDEKFLKNVSPNRILYSVDKAIGFEEYAKKAGASGISYVYGLYPREEDDVIVSQFSDLTRQISSALTNGAADSSSSGGAK